MIQIEGIRKVTKDTRDKMIKKSLKKLYKRIDKEIKLQASLGHYNARIDHADKYFAIYDPTLYFQTVTAEYKGYVVDCDRLVNGEVVFKLNWSHPKE